MALDKLRDILSVQLSVDYDIVNADTDIVYDLGADSLDVAELVMGVEYEFGLALTDEMVSSIRTVGELAALIENFVPVD